MQAGQASARSVQVMFSQLFTSVTPLGLGMSNLQSAGNADTTNPGGMSSKVVCTSLDGGATEMSHYSGSRASPTKLL